jgi:hypothetical protein
MRRLERQIYVVLTLAVAVSIVHYVDNVSAYDRYPQSGTIPNPSAGFIAVSWFLFSAFAVAAVVLLRRGQLREAAICLAAYSGSGLVGILHYAVGGTGDFPWWRHAHIVADITLGTAVLVLAFRLAQQDRPAT